MTLTIWLCCSCSESFREPTYRADLGIPCAEDDETQVCPHCASDDIYTTSIPVYQHDDVRDEARMAQIRAGRPDVPPYAPERKAALAVALDTITRTYHSNYVTREVGPGVHQLVRKGA